MRQEFIVCSNRILIDDIICLYECEMSRAEIRSLLFFIFTKAVLKVIVDILAMLIGAEGAPSRSRKAKPLERKSSFRYNNSLIKRKKNDFFVNFGMLIYLCFFTFL